MGSPRDYMRDARGDFRAERTSVHIWLICAFVAMYVLQHVLLKVFEATPGLYLAFEYNTYLTVAGLKAWKLWTLLSYSLCHDPGNLLHILFGVLGLYFMGRELEPALGSWRFLLFYSLCVIGGGLTYAAAHWDNNSAAVVGSSAGITGLLILFVCLNPDRPITFLFLFFPITLPKARYLGYAVAVLEGFGFFFYELKGGGASIAYSAHIGGLLTALAYHFATRGGIPLSWPSLRFWKRKTEVVAPTWSRKSTKLPPPGFKLNLGGDRERLKAEVDRILDKINSKGFGSLTPEERRTLDEAKDLLGKN